MAFAYVCGTLDDSDADALTPKGMPGDPVVMDAALTAAYAAATAAGNPLPALLSATEHDAVLHPTQVDAVTGLPRFTRDDFIILSTRIGEVEEPEPLPAPQSSSFAAGAAAGAGAAGAAAAAAPPQPSAVQRYFAPPPEKHDKESWGRLRDLLDAVPRLQYVSATMLKSSLIERPGLTFNWLQRGMPCIQDVEQQISGVSMGACAQVLLHRRASFVLKCASIRAYYYV